MVITICEEGLSENAGPVTCSGLHTLTSHNMPKASSYCPSCGKKFKDHSSVAHHMSQPLSGCNTWLDDLIQLEQSSCSPEDHAMEVDDITKPYISDSYEPVGFMDSGDAFGEGESMERMPQDKIQDEGSEVTDHFPNPRLPSRTDTHF
jgi:hypothetical protein